KIAHVVVVQKDRVLCEDRTLRGLLHVALQRHESLLPRLAQKFVHHLEGVQIALLRDLRSLKDPDHPGDDLLKNMQGIRHQYGTDRSPGNDDQLRRLQQHPDIAMLHQVAADHCRNDYENSDDRKHDRPVPYTIQLRAVRDSPWAGVLHPKSLSGRMRAAIPSPPSTTVLNQRFIPRRLP